MSIRICTLGVPLFRLHDLEVNEQWLAVEKFTEKQRASLVAHAGRFVQVHKGDAKELERLGLSFETAPVTNDRGESTGEVRNTGRLVPLEKKSNPKTDAPKGDATGKAGAKKE